MKKIVLILALAAPCAYGQSSGWADLGYMLGGGHKRDMEDAYRDQYRKSAEARASVELAREMSIQNDHLELQNQIRANLAKSWEVLGLDPLEAKSIAYSYILTNEQLAHIERAKRDGYDATMNAVAEAYNNRQYQLANQLVVAASTIKK